MKAPSLRKGGTNNNAPGEKGAAKKSDDWDSGESVPAEKVAATRPAVLRRRGLVTNGRERDRDKKEHSDKGPK